MLILGGIEDNINKVIWAQISDGIFKITSTAGLDLFQPYRDLLWNFTHPLASNQPITSVIFSALISLFKFNGYYSILIITALLNLYFSYIFFKKYKNGWIYTLLFSFSAYFWVHLWHHPDLAQIWVVPWVLKNLIDYHSNKDLKLLVKAAVKIIFVVLVSNYLGFILLLTFGLFMCFALLTKEVSLKRFLGLVSTPVVVLAIILFPYVKSNLIDRKYDVSVPKVGYVSRDLGDFMIFSSRPWYYAIPFPKNLFVGDVSTKIYSDLTNKHHYLLDDYFPAEHAENYLGISLLAVFGYILFKRPKKIHYVELLTLVSLFVLTMPPFFTIHGAKVYLPGYLVYLFTPMFRVTARFSIVILFLILYLIAENLDLKNKKLQIVFVLFMLFNLVDTFVTPSYVDTSKYSSTYDYLRTSTPEQSRFIAYPFSLTKDAYLHLPQHQRYLVNTRNYNSENFNGMKFNSEAFTNALLNNADQNLLKSFQVKYLLLDKKYEEQFLNTSGLNLKLINSSSSLDLYEINY